MDLQQTPAAVIVLAIFVIASIAGFMNRGMWNAWMLHPHGVLHHKRWYLLLTYGFVHGDVAHLLFNAVSYYSIAPVLERVLGIPGFIAVYAGSLVLGAIPSVLLHHKDVHYRSLGASGAISGLFFSGMLFFPEHRIHLFFLPVGIPYPLFGILFLAGSWYGMKRNLGNIGHDVHLYGALAGLLLTLLLRPDSLAIFLSGVS